MAYSFTIIVKPYTRNNCILNDMRTIYNNKVCIVAKNSKFGGLYLHKSAKIIKGGFCKNAGSIRYPILISNKEVHIRVENLNESPNIITDQINKQNIITIIDIIHN